jgi:hypothetical protein
MKPDWGAIETEYITSDISQRALAKKHSIPYATFRGHCKRDWAKKREEYQRKTIAKTLQKTAEAKVDAGIACTEYMRDAARIFSQAFPVMAARIVQEADVKGAEIYARAMNAQIDNNAKLFGNGVDSTIRLYLTDELRELAK